MIKLPVISDFDLQGKKVIVRADLDVNVLEGNTFEEEDLFRLKALLPTLDLLTRQKAKIILIGHRGRPEGKINPDLSLSPVSVAFEKLLIKEWGEERVKAIDLMMMDNLRFDPGEEKNDAEHAQHLAEHGEFFINEAFAASHRAHTSIVGLPKVLPHAAGLRFAEEVKNLEKITSEPTKPVVMVIGGAKKDKLDYLKDLERIADKIYVTGRLPEYLQGNEDSVRLRNEREKTVVGNLIFDKEDITIHTIEVIEQEVAKAGTIILAGPQGKYEEEGHRLGTKRVIEAIAESQAYKVAGGGDTQKALAFLKLENKFDWISVGGGACLEFLAKGTLPGIEALLN